MPQPSNENFDHRLPAPEPLTETHKRSRKGILGATACAALALASGVAGWYYTSGSDSLQSERNLTLNLVDAAPPSPERLTERLDILATTAGTIITRNRGARGFSTNPLYGEQTSLLYQQGRAKLEVIVAAADSNATVLSPNNIKGVLISVADPTNPQVNTESVYVQRATDGWNGSSHAIHEDIIKTTEGIDADDARVSNRGIDHMATLLSQFPAS